jgi:uncharacterized protein YdaT
MLKEILVVSGKPGLYKLVSQGNNLLIVESLIDKKRIPTYVKDKVICLGDISIYTDEDEVSIGDVFTAIREKENGGNVSINLLKAQPDDLRAYFAEILPGFDRERVYPSDIKKVLKWYELLISNNITDFSKKKDNTIDDEAEDEDAKKASAKATAKTMKRKENSKTLTAAKSTKAKPFSKASTPKKSVVGAKRGG